MISFQQRFLALAATRSPLCVGIDPSPETLRRWGLTDDVSGVRQFCDRMVDVCAPLVAVIKPQSAFFERFGPTGMEELRHTVQFAKSHGALVIIDVKRGDIASSAIAYGAAYLGPASAFGGDAITVSPYLGTGSLTPIFDIAVRQEAGVFVVVRSTNPEGIELQEAILGDGRAVWENISDNITAYNLGVMSSQSIGPIGAVVGATLGQNAALIADRLPNALMLVPGIGAQGANLQDVKSHFGSHYSRVIPSISRSIASAGPNADALNRSVQQSAYLAR